MYIPKAAPTGWSGGLFTAETKRADYGRGAFKQDRTARTPANSIADTGVGLKRRML